MIFFASPILTPFIYSSKPSPVSSRKTRDVARRDSHFISDITDVKVWVFIVFVYIPDNAAGKAACFFAAYALHLPARPDHDLYETLRDLCLFGLRKQAVDHIYQIPAFNIVRYGFYVSVVYEIARFG